MKNIKASISFCFLVYGITIGQKTELDNLLNIEFFRTFRKLSYTFFGRTGLEGGQLLTDAINEKLTQDTVPDFVPFPCNISAGRSAQVPDSVHKLKPGDVDIIAAMGDSLTAGNGIFATQLPHVFIENRGASATAGGQGTWRNYLTLPNILKEFNVNLFGYSTSDSPSIDPESQFNVAEPGAMSQDLPFMARVLVKKMKNDKRVDLFNHWKLITIFMGSNDFCSNMCWLSSPWLILKQHKEDLLNALRILRDKLPRSFVQLMPPPHMKLLVEINGRSPLCQLAVDFECPCMFGLTWRHKREEFYEVMKRWQTLDKQITMEPEFQRNDFTVVFQPFPINLTFPRKDRTRSDLTYLSKDCFHLSQKANARSANALWNNMLEPLAEKSEDWDETFTRFLCPTEERPFLATWKNN